MAAATGLSTTTIQRRKGRQGRKIRLKRHRLKRYMASNDPAFEEKAADIIGLSMDLPEHATVSCVDGRAIQALDRLDPVLPLSPGRAERHGFEYYRRQNALSNAALDVETAKCTGKQPRRDTSAETARKGNPHCAD